MASLKQQESWEAGMRWTTKLLLAIAALAAPSMTVWAQAWPTKPVRIVVPFGPGGPADIYARILGQELSEVFKQQFVVENKAGAGGTIGADIVAKSDRKSTRLNSSHLGISY